MLAIRVSMSRRKPSAGSDNTSGKIAFDCYPEALIHRWSPKDIACQFR